MTRALVAAALTAVAAGPAFGQGIREPRPPVPPNRNLNSLPARWWSPGPGMPLYFGQPYGQVYGFSLPWYLPPAVAPGAVVVRREGPVRAGLPGAGVPADVPAAASEPVLPAEFVVQFPASAEVWVNGKKVDGDGATRTLTSPPLTTGERYTFAVKARWTLDGDAYEWERTIALGPGERSRATVAAGFKVKE